jgi:hypothetical protein
MAENFAESGDFHVTFGPTGIKCLKFQTEINVSNLENKQRIPTLKNTFLYH